jgi:hypothetical protein
MATGTSRSIRSEDTTPLPSQRAAKTWQGSFKTTPTSDDDDDSVCQPPPPIPPPAVCELWLNEASKLPPTSPSPDTLEEKDGLSPLDETFPVDDKEEEEEEEGKERRGSE